LSHFAIIDLLIFAMSLPHIDISHIFIIYFAMPLFSRSELTIHG